MFVTGINIISDKFYIANVFTYISNIFTILYQCRIIKIDNIMKTANKSKKLLYFIRPILLHTNILLQYYYYTVRNNTAYK